MKPQRASSQRNRQSKQSIGIEVVIETPKGSRNKIKFEESGRHFKLSKVMPEGMMFPYDFGFLPSTKADDGDPLDVLVLTDAPLFPGCVVECTLIGAIEAEQKEKSRTNRNDRLVAVANQSLLYSEIKSLEDLNPNVLSQIEAFFVNYQRVRDIEVKILGHADPRRAESLIKAATRKKAA